MESTTTDSMCRCCAAEGIFKDIKTSYHWMGDEEVYGDMLRECFDVNLVAVEEGGICEVCITQLRNAANFKKQVLHTEKKFKRHLDSRRFKPTEVKEELLGDNGNSSDEDNGGAPDSEDDEDYVPEFEIPIKTESPEETKSRKRAAKATTSRAKKSRTTDDEDKNILSSSDEDENTPLAAEKSLTLFRKVNFSSFISIPPCGIPETNKKKKKPLAQKVQKRKISEVIEEKPLEKVERKRTLPKRKSSSKRKHTDVRVKIPNPNPKTRLTEMDWHLDNIRTILNCSNATPIHAKEDNGHSCSYCFQTFSKLTELKKHCFSNHKKGKPDFLKMRPGKILSKHIVYLDISGLKCRVCRADIDSLEMLMEHLQNTHSETMHLVIKNQIMPLRVIDERLRCAVCAVDLDFDKVAEHMSQHYRNYVCEFCDASFVIRCKMLDHKKSVHDV